MIENIESPYSNLHSIYDLLRFIRKRPAMYTGGNTLEHFIMFTRGAIIGSKVCGNKLFNTPDFHGFHDFVAKRLGYYESTAGWANMILGSLVFESTKNPDWEQLSKLASDEHHRQSINLFYDLLDEYCQEQDG